MSEAKGRHYRDHPVTRGNPDAPTEDRSWWKTVYKAGIKADLNQQPRQPPDDLTDEQKAVWLQGYDR